MAKLLPGKSCRSHLPGFQSISCSSRKKSIKQTSPKSGHSCCVRLELNLGRWDASLPGQGQQRIGGLPDTAGEGVYETESNEGWITHGPWGGPNGKAWIWMPKGNIIKITIIHEEFIEAIKFQSDDCTGETESPYYGSPWANLKEDMISVNYPNEYFVSIRGMYGQHGSVMVIKSLCFVTNKKRYGPYGLGTGTGTHFSYDGKGGAIVGFHGRVDAYPNAIGIYVMPGSLVFGRNSTRDDISTHELCSSSMSRMVMPKEMGPFGAFAESLNVLRAIQCVYIRRDSKLFLSSMHGGTSNDKLELAALRWVEALAAVGGGSRRWRWSAEGVAAVGGGSRRRRSTMGRSGGGGRRWVEAVAAVGGGSKWLQRSAVGRSEVVNLDGTDEYLTQISGIYGPIGGFNGLEAITSITFHTNKTIYGPYGVESGTDGYTYFTSTESSGKVVGFHGRECNGEKIKLLCALRRLEREERETHGFIRYGFREEREPVALPAGP
ncbi:hypothetical protein OSB04_006053 [Centaurea solstitialis]|uniref:Jacalin-type lectin domain-containing protein n=1 Tax=Centaurea solstitialis TaxID=347529 RepID=A0AA38TH71_9ASTR|nr:hypothetical protein OSB04_006053 [Centaurea solstitialis]